MDIDYELLLVDHLKEVVNGDQNDETKVAWIKALLERWK